MKHLQTLAATVGIFAIAGLYSASAITPAQVTFDVWGGNTLDLGKSHYEVDKIAGFVKLGSTNRTATFTGSYNCYLVRATKHNVAKIDTVRGSNGSYYATAYTGNTENYLNLGGTPDGLYATFGRTPRGFYAGGFFIVDANGHGLSSITVYAVP